MSKAVVFFECVDLGKFWRKTLKKQKTQQNLWKKMREMFKSPLLLILDDLAGSWRTTDLSCTVMSSKASLYIYPFQHKIGKSSWDSFDKDRALLLQIVDSFWVQKTCLTMQEINDKLQNLR